MFPVLNTPDVIPHFPEGAPKTYVIYIMPRSGSSWLTDLLLSTKSLGNPTEHFNGGWLRGWADSYGVDDIVSYRDSIMADDQRGGVFGTEISWDHIKQIGGESVCVRLLGAETPSFFVYRQNILAQAVSLAKASQTQIYHSTQATPDVIASSEQKVAYRPALIRQMFESLVNAERSLVEMFRRNNMRPIVLCYELMFAQTPEAVANIFSTALDVPLISPPISKHQKIATKSNDEMYDRFRGENASYVDDMLGSRPLLIQRLDP